MKRTDVDSPPTSTELGAFLRLRREALGWSVAETARAVGITAPALALREAGQCRGAEEWIRLLHCLGCDVVVKRRKAPSAAS